MKVKTLSALAGLGGALILSGSADAAYVGLSTQLHSTVSINGVSHDVYRVYANFTSALDQLTVVSGSGAAGPITISQLNAAGNGPGSGFYNDALGGLLAPNPAFFPFAPSLQWDSFVTIGAAVGPQPAPDATSLSPGFVGGLITGTGTTAADSAWFVTPDAPQSIAGADLSVMMAQLTVQSGQHVAGTVNISGVTAAIAGGGQSFTANGQTFSSIPAPGALALLGLAGLVGSRRRRA
jgi:MYXO-CTERM domain-containing protein